MSLGASRDEAAAWEESCGWRRPPATSVCVCPTSTARWHNRKGRGARQPLSRAGRSTSGAAARDCHHLPYQSAVAGAFALALTASWSGIALRLAAADRGRAGVDLFVFPALPVRSAPAIVTWLLVLPGLAYVVLSLSVQMDWGFLLQKTGVLTIWFLAWAAIITLSRGVCLRSFGGAIAVSLIVLLATRRCGRRERQRHRGVAIPDSSPRSAAMRRSMCCFGCSTMRWPIGC